jgi:hypothetical protein
MKTPWHLWLVGVLAVFWYGFGGYDYVMTATRNAAYFKDYPPEIVAYWFALPAWFVAVWAISVWGGLLASVLLLLRRRWAVPLYWISLVALAITFVWTLFIADAPEMPDYAMWMSAAVAIIAIALPLYAGWLARKGVLR